MNDAQNFPNTPDEQEAPAPTTPEKTKRRRFITPVFSTRSKARAGRPMHLMVIVALMVSASAQAQSDSLSRRSTTSGADRNTQMQDQQGQQGWTTFNDDMGRELKITPEEMKRLREMDQRYQAEWRNLGTDPMNNPNYRALNDRRNTDIKGILSPESYQNWQSRYGKTPTSTAPGTQSPAPGTQHTAPKGTVTPDQRTTKP
jgi:hypothetical protein